MLKRFNKQFAWWCYLILMAMMCMPHAIAQQSTEVPLLVPMEPETSTPASEIQPAQAVISESQTETSPAPKVQPVEEVVSEPLLEVQPPEPITTAEPLSLLGASSSLTSVPSDIILLLDNSGSMKKNDPGFLTSQAVNEFISNLDYNTRLGIVIFDQKVKLALPLTQISDQSRSEMLDSLHQINYRGLHTNSPDALERALYELKLHARPDTEKFVILLTDGIVDTGDKQKDVTKADWMRNELAADAKEHGIRIFGIAFTEDADFQLIQSLAQQTDAEYFRAFTASDIAPTFTRIQDSIEQARREKAEAAAKPEPEVIEQPPVVLPQPAPPPEPIIVTVPEPAAEEDPLTKYMLYGILLLLVAVLAAVLLRSRGGAAASDTEAVAMPNAQLIDIQRVTGRKDYSLDKPITQIGRVKGKESPDVAHLVIEESRVSRHHAVIEYRNHAFWVMDQGSGNGTFLNGERLTGERRLKHNDILAFDRFEFMYFEPDMEQSDATVVQGVAPADRMNRPFDEDETALQGAPKVEPSAPQPVPPPVPESQTADLVEDIESWDFSDAEEDEEDSQAHTIVPESLNDEEVEIAETTGETAPPEKPVEEPAVAKEPSEGEALIKKKDGTFQPAKTMTPKEFERLFAEIDKDKK